MLPKSLGAFEQFDCEGEWMRFPAKHIGFILVGVVMLGVTTSGRAQSRFELAKDEVVVFVGGTNMLRLQQAAWPAAPCPRG